ncbi:MAG TPA: type II toxin-antitoxin system VapC family toxin [Chloroflexi bacterium]|nr:type II toxin-antitoxin system VapC family toxin [Chloroflexota bacterium]
MTDYLLDTNHASKLMAQEEPIASQVREAQAAGDRFGFSVTVLGELYYAVYASQYRQRNLYRLRHLLEALLLWPFDEAAAEEFGRIQAEQKAKGRPIPPLDAQIAAVARVYGLTLLTADRHFQFVDDLTTENWLGA